MTQPTTHRRARLGVESGQYFLFSPDTGMQALPGLPERVDNGVAVVADDGVCLLSGMDSGDIWLGVEVWEAPPPLDLDSWDDVVETTITSTTGELTPAEVNAEPDEEQVDWPNLAATGPGTYRLRISVRGRDAGADADYLEEDEEPVEEHRLQAWPAPAEPDVIHQAGDRIGAYWRTGA
ncbi:hypothetical protein [Streptomyces sp. TLI_146]|uniref:hypothetical protein n=1 Tax=Streptomyces sp. TLI_146 TaxID=1938858 RepID=UPI000C7083B4|nr:hypothetical protein [Streptomyces sp. TLI_146]PKV82910.1 hypothetical protein BX283_0379 [Streptomyces sp. TLI_146]